ncbi:hypothetical protein QWY90_01155 [Flavobacterium paronense]|nr:hypothetical protein [Flavobacterium paronense]MDN3675928.1 hypothetical protein [Flavobacterium paronense]
MKNSQKLVGVALLATAAVGLALPSISKAAPSVTGKGKVTFTQDLTTNPSNNKPGESTGPELNEPSQNTDPLALKIVSVTDMDFDSHNIISNDSNKSYEALPFATTTGKDDKKEPVKTAHFVRFQDVRADTTNNYFTISAKMTKQFSNATKAQL